MISSSYRLTLLKSRYFDHPAPMPGHPRLAEYGMNMTDVVRSSVLSYMQYGNRVSPFSKPEAAALDTNSFSRDNVTTFVASALFNIPIADCPQGECVSPINHPQHFNAPCLSGVRSWSLDGVREAGEEGRRKTEEFLAASGLFAHAHFFKICEDRNGESQTILVHC